MFNSELTAETPEQEEALKQFEHAKEAFVKAIQSVESVYKLRLDDVGIMKNDRIGVERETETIMCRFRRSVFL